MALDETGVRFVAENYSGYINAVKGAGAQTAALGKQIGSAASASTVAERRFGSFGMKVGQQFSILGTAAKVGAAGAVAGLLAMAKSSITAASDSSESLNKARVVFGAFSKDVEDFTKNASTNLGLTQRAAVEFAGTFGNLFVSMRLPQQQAAEMSKSILQLGADFASFYNIPVDIALEKLRAGLVGEVEPLRTLGINLSAVAVEQKAVSMGLVDQGEKLNAAQKAQAAYALIMEQSATAQGDFARTSDGMANRTRILTASIGDAQVAFGKAFGTVTQQILGSLVDIISSPKFTGGLEKLGNILATVVLGFREGFNAYVIPALKWLADNGTRVAMAVASIGIAFAIFHPVGAVVIGLGMVITALGIIRSNSSKLPPEMVKVKLSVVNLAEEATHAFRTLGAEILKTLVSPLQLAVYILNALISGLNSLSKSKITIGFGPLGSISLGGGKGLNIPEIPTPFDLIDKQLNNRFEFTKEETTSLKDLKTATDASAKSIRDGAIPAFDGLGASAGDAGGAAGAAKEEVDKLAQALEDSIVTLNENIESELGLTAAQAGAMEATRFLADQVFEQEERTWNLGKAASSLSVVLGKGEQAFATFTKRMVDGALQLQRTAAAAIFGRPTREEAALQLQIAQLEQMGLNAEISNEPARIQRDAEVARLAQEIDSLRDRASSIDIEDQKVAQAQRDSIEREIRAREDQIRSLQIAGESVRGPFDQLRESLSRQLAAMEAENRVQQLQLQLADHTLLSEQEQYLMQRDLLKNISELSLAQRNQASLLNESVIPEFNEAAKAAIYMRDAFYSVGLSLTSIPGRAYGGTVAAGQPYWVGERGVPELFIPRQSGSVVPQTMANRTAGMRGGNSSSVTNHFSISAVLPNVLNAEQLLVEADRLADRRLHLSSVGVAS